VTKKQSNTMTWLNQKTQKTSENLKRLKNDKPSSYPCKQPRWYQYLWSI